MEPDAQAIVDAWLMERPAMRVVHVKSANEDRIVMEFCERHEGYGWLVTTVDFEPQAWAYSPVHRAEMLKLAFHESRANFLNKPNG